MLDLIRKKQRSIIIKVIFWGIIATFVGTIFLVWGKGSDERQQDAGVAVTVNKTKIGIDEFQTAYANLYRFYQNIYREQLTPQVEKQLRLRQQALDALIEQALLVEEARRQGVKVSEQELVDSIAKIPAFQEQGAFSKQLYVQVLAYQRLTPEIFEEMQRRQLLVQKVREKLQEGVAVTDADVAEEFRRQNEKASLAFVRLLPASFEARVRVDETALKSFFEERREEFRLPESLALSYLVFDPASFEKEVTVADGELEKYYQRHLDRYEIPEQVRAAHILIRSPQGAAEAQRQEKRALAEKVLQEAKAGKDFAALARRYSEDPGSAAVGGDLGLFPRGAMVPSFEEAAFALKPGEISGIVESPFGFHVLKAIEHIEAGVRPLVEVTVEVRAGLLAEKARQLAFEKAMDAYQSNRKAGGLEAAAKAAGLPVRQTGFFGRQQPVNSLGEAPQVADAAFALQAGEMGRPVELPQGVVLFAVRERRESRLPELNEVRAAAEQAFRQQQARELARQAAAAILAGLKGGKDLAGLARPYGVQVEETGLFSRATGAFLPRLGDAEALAKTAFDLTPQAPAAPEVYEVDGAYVAAQLKERVASPAAGPAAAERETLRTSLLESRKEEILTRKLKELREKAEIVYAPTLNIEEDGQQAKPQTKEAAK
jgi:peptidyl-prolyl cis-trans isomerase D